MFTLALVATLNLAGSTGAPSVVDHATRSYLSQVPEGYPPAAVQRVRSLFELNHELEELEHDRPGLGFPIAFMAVGGAVLVFEGLIALGLYVIGGLSYFAALWPVALAVAIIAVAAFLGTGVMMLVIRLHQRHSYDERIEALRAELAARQNEHPYNLQRGDEFLPPPPPPPPPPQGFAPVLEPWLVVAEF